MEAFKKLFSESGRDLLKGRKRRLSKGNEGGEGVLWKSLDSNLSKNRKRCSMKTGAVPIFQNKMKEGKVIKTQHLLIHPITQRHLKFLLKLWNDPQIMQYAGFARNWNYEQIKGWYEKYKKRLAKYGSTEIQFIIRLKKGTLIGESGIGRLRANWSCRNYKTPQDKLVLMTDVKLAKSFWNKRYGTEAMKAIAQYVFTETDADLFLVPPHRDNVPAIKVYEKAGFKKTKGIWYGYHMIYKMNKKDFEDVYRGAK